MAATFVSLDAPVSSKDPPPGGARIARDEKQRLGEHVNHRTAVVTLCLVYMFLLALAQGHRYGRMGGRRAKSTMLEVLVFIQGFIGISFVLSVGIISGGLGLATDAQCHAAIRICISLYGAGKIVLYLFLLERVHVVRAPFLAHSRDPLWVVGAVVTVGGFGAIAGYQFVAPMAKLSREDGLCRIGIATDASLAVIAIDTTISVTLTGVFIWLLRPAFSSVAVRSQTSHGHAPQGRRRSIIMIATGKSEKTKSNAQRTSSRQNMKTMLLRNIIGSALVMLNTIVNNTIFLTWEEAHKSHICLLTCLTDIVVGTLVTYWLTLGSRRGGDGSYPASSSSDTSTAATADSVTMSSRRATLDNPLQVPNDIFQTDPKCLPYTTDIEAVRSNPR